MLKNLAWLGGLVILPLAVFALLTTLPLPAQAQGEPPHLFIGTAKADGSPVADGSTVTAWDGGTQIGSATTAGGGNFTIQVSRSSGVIRFKINGIYAAETHPYFQPGQNTGTASDRFILTAVDAYFLATADEPGVAAQYTITFTATADYNHGSDNLVIELEDFGFPSNVSLAAISIRPEGSNAASPQAVTVDFEKLNITLPDFDPATSATDTDADKINSGESVTVTIQQSAGISTPTEGGDYPAIISGPGDDVTTAPLDIRRVVKLSVSEGSRGTVVTATGRGFKNGTSLSFFLDTNANGMLDSGEILLCQVASVGSDDTGSCGFTVNNPPFSPGYNGYNYVNAVDGRGQHSSATQHSNQRFTLTPSIQSVIPETVAAGQLLIVRMVDVPDVDEGYNVEGFLGGNPFGYSMAPIVIEFPNGANGFPVDGELNYHFIVPSQVQEGIYSFYIYMYGEQVDWYGRRITVTTPMITPTPRPTATPYPTPTPTPILPVPTAVPAPTTEPPQLPGSSEPPHIFAGQATLNGNPAGQGVAIDAYDGGRLIGATVTQAGGRFSIHVHRAEGVITFRVNNQAAAESWTAWQRGQVTTGFDLTAGGDSSRETDPARLFAALPDLVRAFGFDNATKQWSFFDPAAADVSTLTRFMPGNIYWLLVAHTTSLALNGVERDLFCVEEDCWNLIAW